MINLSNYEDWFLLYADGELTVAEQETVLQFVNMHPDLKEELDLLMSVRFRPENEIKLNDTSTIKAEYFNELKTKYRFEPDLNVQFPDKQLLYKRTAAPVVSMFRYVVVAASTVVTVGLIWWFTGNGSVKQAIVQAEIKKETPVILPSDELRNQQKELIVIAQPAREENLNTIVKNSVEDKFVQDDLQNQQIEAEQIKIDEVEPVIVPIENELKSNFSQDAIAAAEARMDKNSSVEAPVTLPPTTPINTAIFIDAELNSEKQLPVRGLLRKISRTLLNDNKEDEGQKFIQFAVFKIPVKQ